MLTPNDIFQRSFIISISNEKYNKCIQIFKQKGISVLPRKFSAIHITDNKAYSYFDYFQNEQVKNGIKQICCGLSHSEIVKFAKMMDLPYVCIFEDDAYPCNGIKDKLEYYIDNIPSDIKFLILGNIQFSGCGIHSTDDRYYKVCLNYGSHAYIVFKNGYDEYLEKIKTANCVADMIFNSLDSIYSVKENLFVQANMSNQSISHNNGQIHHRTFSKQNLEKWFPPLSSYEEKYKI